MAEFVAKVEAGTLAGLEAAINAVLLPLTSHTIRRIDVTTEKINGRTSLVLKALIAYDDAGVVLTDPFVVTLSGSSTLNGAKAAMQDAIDNTFGVVFVSSSQLRQIILGKSISLFISYLFKNDDGANAANNWLASGGSVITNHQSLLFNGVDTYLSANAGGSIISIPSGTTYTIMQWHKMDPSIAAFAGLWGDNPTQDYLQILNSSDPRNFRFRANAATVAQTASSFNTNIWQQTYARTRGTSSWGLWVNGDNNFATSAQSARQVNLDAIGRRGGSRYWLGNITLMAIWSRTLTGTERNNLYNGGAPADPATTVPSGLIHLWRMDETNKASFPLIPDEIGAADLVMNNMTLANYVSDYPS